MKVGRQICKMGKKNEGNLLKLNNMTYIGLISKAYLRIATPINKKKKKCERRKILTLRVNLELRSHGFEIQG